MLVQIARWDPRQLHFATTRHTAARTAHVGACEADRRSVASDRLAARKLIVAPLAAHFEEQGVEFMQFAFRWMNCLLMREMSVKCTIRMWDTYLVSHSLLRHWQGRRLTGAGRRD